MINTYVSVGVRGTVCAVPDLKVLLGVSKVSESVSDLTGLGVSIEFVPGWVRVKYGSSHLR